MNTPDGQTTMVCLFHSMEHAESAIKDLVEAGVPKDSIGTMQGTAANPAAAMNKWRIPERDAHFLTEGINKGGIVIAVATANNDLADRVEEIFARHQASKVDDVSAKSASATVAGAVPVAISQTGGTIDVVEEEMTVGKREVQRGGVRIFQRIVETPVSKTVKLREEHVTVQRHPVDRPVSASDGSAFKDRSFEVTTTNEEAVVSKQARVVEEVVVGKEATEHTETVKGSVRRRDVTIEEIPSEPKTGAVGRK